MQIRNKIFTAVVVAAIAIAFPFAAGAQSSSINTFSPYTLYGIGDISTQGNTYIRSMGGAGSAFRNPIRINYLNPASMTAGLQYAFMINMGLEGENYYLRSDEGKTSYNSFNIRDLAIQFPMGKFLAFGVSVTPMSNVGYRISEEETNTDIIADLGHVMYNYEGSGGLNQAKAGIGVAVNPRLSLGAEVVYYLGNINRSFDVVITPITSPNTQNNIYSYERNSISRVFANFGLQYNLIMNEKHLLTLGATFQPGGNLDPKVTRMIPSGGLFVDTVSFGSHLSDFKMPSLATVGFFYHSHKAAFGADYSYQNWDVNNSSDMAGENIRYRNTNAFKLGGEFTPNRLDVRRFMNRVTYRAGLRYSDYYMIINDQKINEKAVTFGVGIPLRTAGRSSINLGIEFGTRGTTSYNLIKENYFKFSIGLSLFGEDYWFVKQKYD